MDDEERDKPWNFHTCKLCSYRSRFTVLMCKHVRQHHERSKTDTFKCEVNSPELFVCGHCLFETDLKVELQDHLIVNHKEKKEKNFLDSILKCYKCQDCALQTYSLLVITKHIHSVNHVETVKKLKALTKSKKIYRYLKKPSFCHFCKKLKTNIARHFELCHATERAVKKFIVLKKGSHERLRIISNIRKKGNFEYSQIYEGAPILSRRTCKSKEPSKPKNSYLRCRKPIVKLEPSTKPTKKSNLQKRNRCHFCNKLRINIGRHFELSHRNEGVVKKNLVLEKGNPERDEIISNIEKKGNFMNSQVHEGIPIISRRTYKPLEPSYLKENTLPCPKSGEEIKPSTKSTNKTYWYPKKRNFCLFCKMLKTNIARHFEIAHANEEAVQKFLVLKKGSAERYEVISELRMMGNFEYNQVHEDAPILCKRTIKSKKT